MNKKTLLMFKILSTTMMVTVVCGYLVNIRNAIGLTKQLKEQAVIMTERIDDYADTTQLLVERVQQYKEQVQQYEERLAELQTSFENKESSDWNTDRAVATAYSPFDNVSGIEAEGEGTVTSIGLTPGPNVIAVDPAKIPYGSTIVVIYPDGSILEGIAGDTGGALRDADYILLDIFKQTYVEACAHGRQDVTILWK